VNISIGVTTSTNIILRGIINLSNYTTTTNGHCRRRRQRLTRSVFDEPLGWLKHRRFHPCSYFQRFEFLVVAASMAEGEVEVVVALEAVVVISSMLITSLISEEEDEDTRDGLSTAVVVVVVNDDNVDVTTSTWK
jgi:hypothetical protein